MHLLQVRCISNFVMFDFICVYLLTCLALTQRESKSAPPEACSLGA